ncbi:putative N6-adenine-specific DNA methylase [Neoasaia chiangmaiensis NBRC 101099]|uniref:RNA methyltransferase n=1 Tax=Neoasaia chiangmaiensis TaxID=320497 RepID=A0A1U9KPZ6_9PROT|nr:THUMP domain-containing protein [Neoasaia chiangmaiensis]AQS87780.1 RNA methyltransferase [Neoasaia chiangmaiensis]GBR41578.1 putative N6-adenine-specific DNA methylase [Neoasaia chiangmaiensis NBRC 101099]GEN14383.1 RNA methyltransferase [Neoasaia chiangmaiensis]
MTTQTDFEIFLTAPPGLEAVLCEEVRLKGFKRPQAVPGGVVTRGGWPDIWRANLWIRGATRVLARIDAFHVKHLAHLDDRARRVEWAAVLRPDVPFRVEASSAASRIYHAGAAAERIGKAIRETLGAPCDPENAGIVVRARIEHDLCTISVDTSGTLLHRRGHKEAVNRAPMRETMASLFLRQCGFDGSETVIDPMCGSGTFVIEAAEIAARLNPGRSRHFAFEHLATFDAQAWQSMRDVRRESPPGVRFHGRDRDAGAIAMSRANAERAGVTDRTDFQQGTISELEPPEGPAGLVIANPPYGTRIGDKGKLVPLYRTFGRVLKERFPGWRVAIVTAEAGLARATELPFRPTGAPVPHGGLRVTLYQTDPLA